MQFVPSNTYYDVGLSPTHLVDMRPVRYVGPAVDFCREGALCFERLDDGSQFAHLDAQQAAIVIVDHDGLLKIVAAQIPTPNNRSEQLFADEVWKEAVRLPSDHFLHDDGTRVVVEPEMGAADFRSLFEPAIVRSLELRCPVDEVVLAHVSQCTSVEELTMWQAACTDWDAIGTLHQLRTLDIRGATLDWTFAFAIRNCPRITSLWLSECVLDASALEAIHRMKQLLALCLFNVKCTDGWRVQRMQSAGSLRTLMLQNAPIGRRALQRICADVGPLSSAIVSGTPADDEICGRLTALPSLRDLYLRNTPTSVKWVLEEHLTNEHCRIIP